MSIASAVPAHRRRATGMSLVEFLVALAVLAIAVLAGVPSLRDFFDRNRLVGAAEAVYAQARLARAEALHQGSAVTLTLLPGNSWCAGHRTEKLTAGPGSAPEPCDCRRLDALDPDACTVESDGDRLLRTTNQAAFPDVSMGESVPGLVRFNGVRGTASPGAAIALSTARGAALRVEVLPGGNVRLCAPGTPFRGYPPC